MSDQDLFSFDSFCPYCRENKSVQLNKTELKNAIADNQNIRVGGILCGHMWDLAPSERHKLRDLLPKLSN